MSDVCVMLLGWLRCVCWVHVPLPLYRRREPTAGNVMSRHSRELQEADACFRVCTAAAATAAGVYVSGHAAVVGCHPATRRPDVCPPGSLVRCAGR